jgi:hypothetical protein
MPSPVTGEGMNIDESEEQSENAKSPMCAIFEPNSNDTTEREEQL